MHDGLVRSCNAYFAQLAVRVGPAPLTIPRTCRESRSPDRPAARMSETLPHAGYGQGDVWPRRCAWRVWLPRSRGDGMIREARRLKKARRALVRRRPVRRSRALGSYMRDAVTNGTGRARRPPGRIAGKTGTAEVDDAASHAWFVGYAPYGPAERRIAFAVLLENAGYGGAAAAPAAGEIVTAAAASGWLNSGAQAPR